MPRVAGTFSTGLRTVFSAALADAIVEVAWSTDGRLLAATPASGPVSVLDVADQSQRTELDEHPGGTTSVAWHPTASLLASGGQDGTVRTHPMGVAIDAEEALAGRGWVTRVAWSPAGGYLAAAIGRELHVWEPGSGARRTSSPEEATIADVAWHPAADQIATVGYGGGALWMPELAEPVRLPWKGSSLRLAWSPDGRWLVSGNQDHSVHVWEVERGSDLEMWGYERKPLELAWDASGRWLATGGGATIAVWDCGGRGPDGREPKQLTGHRGPVRTLAYAQRSPTLASAGDDGRVSIWHPDVRRRPVATLELDAPATALAWGLQDRLLAAGDADGRVHVLRT